MKVEHMKNHLGHISRNNMIIEHDCKLYMVSYDEIVIVKNGHNVAVKKSAKERSKTTNRFIGYFLKRYCQLCNLSAIEWMGDEEFDLLCR